MALEIITPFRSDNYQTMVSDFICWVAEHVESTPLRGRIGWMSHLQGYRWNGQGWREGMNKRWEFHERITHLQSDEDFHEVVGDILSWGRMNSFGAEDICSLRSSLKILDALREGKDIAIHDLFIDRVAAASKIYEMYDPYSWVIYDSRVVRGLASLVTTWWELNGRNALKSLLRFPWPPGRGDGRPPLGLPRVAKTAPKQPRLGFIYASWLSGAIARKIREASGNSVNITDRGLNWEAYHVEMVLFMLGAPDGTRNPD